MTRSLKPIKMFLGVILGITCAGALHAATATFQQGVNGYTGTADTDLNADQPTTVQGNDTAVLVDQNAPISHALIRFDNIFGGGPGQVPLNATITSATLTFVTSNVGDPIFGFRVLVPWDEATSTWTTMVNGVSIADGELHDVADFTLDGNAVGQVDTLDVTATVQGWFAGTFPNHGWGMTNSIGDGWQFPSSENATVAQRPILTIVFDAPCAPISIVTQPSGGTINEGSAHSFSVIVAGTDPQYQWFKDGIPLPDATNSIFNLNPALRTDDGTYTVSINNPCSGPVNSANAVLNVVPDLTGPTIACAYGTNDALTLFVQFSEIVTNATDPVNYSVFPTGDPGSPLTVATAAYSGGGSQSQVIVLTLDPSTPLAPGASYSMSAGAIFDRFGNPNDANEVAPIHLYAERIFTISADQIWTYNDSGTDLGTAWKEKTFNDSGWASGAALLGFEDSATPEPIRTPVARTNAAGVVTRTHYFRTHFNYPTAGSAVLRFRTVVDDAPAIYLNGVEIFRMRLPAGPLTWLTEGTGDAVGNGAYEGPFTVCVTNLMAGDNVLAVEVHQTGAASSDMLWGMELSRVVTAITPVTIVTQPVGTNVLEPAPFSLRVEAGGSNPQYQWFLNGTAIDGATNAIYSVSRSDCAIHDGTYHVVVFNDAPSSVTSLSRVVNVQCDDVPPTVVCVFGTNDAVVVQFSEVVTNIEEFTFNFVMQERGTGNFLQFTSGTFTSGTNTGDTVVLVIDPSTPRNPDAAYDISISGMSDLFGNDMEPVTLGVPLFAGPPLIGINATQQWRYETTGTDLGTAWSAKTFVDTAWPTGLALFDGARGTNGVLGVDCRDVVNGQPVRTCITISNATGTAQITAAYFRTHFNYAGPSTAVLAIRPYIDDGAAYYLNGQEVLRVRMPATHTYATLAQAPTVGSANFEGPYYVCVTNLTSGDNVLAVEVHQASLTSSDLTFGTELAVLTDSAPSRLTITSGPNPGQVTVSWTGGGVLQASSNLGNPSGWANVAGVVGSSYVTQATGNRFFRLAP